MIRLPSGRKLGYHSCGPADGTPVVYIHGHPDSGITITSSIEARVAQDLNIKWIGPDRPGVGESSAYDWQEVMDYPSDISSLISHLQVPEYHLLGTSGGTGFTLACAKDLKHLHPALKGVGICAGVGPVECGFDSMHDAQLKAIQAWRDYPDEFKQYYETEYVPLAQSEDASLLEAKLRGEYEASFTGRDKEILMEESTFKQGVAALRQAWKQGAWAHAHGMAMHWKSWGFRLEDIGYPGIKLWYGGKDQSTTPIMGRYMAARLPDADYVEFPDDSHYTVWTENNLRAMIRSLIGR